MKKKNHSKIFNNNIQYFSVISTTEGLNSVISTTCLASRLHQSVIIQLSRLQLITTNFCLSSLLKAHCFYHVVQKLGYWAQSCTRHNFYTRLKRTYGIYPPGKKLPLNFFKIRVYFQNTVRAKTITIQNCTSVKTKYFGNVTWRLVNIKVMCSVLVIGLKIADIQEFPLRCILFWGW